MYEVTLLIKVMKTIKTVIMLLMIMSIKVMSRGTMRFDQKDKRDQ